MLVIDIPERIVPENAAEIGNLEKDKGVSPLSDGSSDGLDEPSRVVDVLERHFAADDVGVDIGIGLTVKVLDKDQTGRVRRRVPAGNKGWIESNPGVIPQFAEERKKLSFAASDLDDTLSTVVLFFDQRLCQPQMESLKRW